MMILTKKFNLGFTLMLFCILLSSCGPSPEELAATSVAETAAAATNTPIPPTITSTPTPTPTPTPVPYDLSVLITGEDETPIEGAIVYLDELDGNDNSLNSDDVGQVFWNDLPGEMVNLTITAQGYFSKEITETIVRGVNQVEVKLDRDPHGILPSEACGPNETLLYVEDFQDMEAQGWPDIEFRSQGWDLVSHPESVGNQVASFTAEYETQIFYQGGTFEDAVWRVRFMHVGRPTYNTFGWHFVDEPYEAKQGTVESSDYSTWFDDGYLRVFRGQWPFPTISLLGTGWPLKKDVWHEIEISSFFDTLELWVNGKHLLKYNDPQPLPGGSLYLSAGSSNYEGTKIYYDNLVICGLSEPFVPKPTSEP